MICSEHRLKDETTNVDIMDNIQHHLLQKNSNKHITLQIKDGEPIYYHRLHKIWKITGGPQNVINFLCKIYLCLPKENTKIKLCQGARDTSQSTCLLVMGFRF